MNLAIPGTGLLTRGLLALLVSALNATAQPVPSTGTPVPAKVASSATATPPKVAASRQMSTTAWSELSPAQQQALKPLASNWNGIDEAQKRKWLAMSRNFAAWPPAEQAKLHSRMTEWVALSPRQRAQARLNFAETTKVPADEKKARWESYQSLSPEEKSKLAAGASQQPAGVANAVRPVPAQKLATTPQAKAPGRAASGPVNVLRQVDKNTLLPHPPGKAP